MNPRIEPSERLAELVRTRDLEALRALLRHGRWRVRREALRALLELAAPGAEKALVEALADRARGPVRDAYDQLRERAEAVLPLLSESLNDDRVGPACAAVLACSSAGRDLLWQLDDHGSALLMASLQRPHLPVRTAIAVTKALVIGEDERVGDSLAALLDHDSVMLRYAAGRALYARWDRRAVPWVIESLGSQPPSDATMLEWLGEQGDARALPILRKLASPWRAIFGYLPPRYREAAKAAVAAIELEMAQIPAGAISLARSSPELNETALSLWREGETAGEAGADDGG